MTLTELHAEIDATAGYEAADSVALAGRFQTAVRMLRIKLPASVGKDGVTTTFSLADLAALEEQVTRWIQRKAAGSQHRYFSVRGYRS